MVPTLSIRGGRSLLIVGLVATLATSAWAVTPKKEASAFLEQKEFFRPELAISSSHDRLEQVIDRLPNKAAWQSFMQQQSSLAEGASRPALRVFVDPRSGAATNIMGTFPLIPGRGVGNKVTLQGLGQSLGQPVAKVDGAVVSRAVRNFVETRKGLLGIDTLQLGEVKATQINDFLWHVTIPQVYRGVPVRDGRVAGAINHGNLVVIGAETWGNVHLNVNPRFSAEQALENGFAYAEGRIGQDEIVRQPALEIVPVAPQEQQADGAFAGPVGKGYGHRLVWTFVFQRPPDEARWEVMVDAYSGEVIAFQDVNHYAQKQFKGGIYPLTSTGICPDADHCGTMQSNYPMPWANTGFAAPNNFTNSAGIYDYTSGTATTTLNGKYIRMSDSCGAVSESSGTGDINLGGSNNQHDCTSGGSSAGNTPASRSGFYELNKLAELARGWLPGNTWLQGQLTANMNLNSTCNAFWNGSTVNFYRSGGGCRNTGELAAVFDHEWGHGMDDFDSGGVLSNSSEAYADIAAIYRLEASCVGHGFFWTLDDGCGQTPDGTGFNVNEAQVGAAHCATDCSGVRDADYAKHNPATPQTALGFVCNSCGAGSGPCGKQVHCAAAPVRQAAWDLVTRDLTATPFNYDSQTAFIIGNKLFYQGSGNVGAWHSCTCTGTPSANGCGATNGYTAWLTADDDNGNLSDGTPHASAIWNAYNRHGIACGATAPANSGCAGGPTAAATLTATPGNNQVSLSWTSVAGATRYWVFRTEGHAGCNLGKTLIADNVTGTSYTDTAVANDRTYYYNVVAAGASSACFGRASSCISATPVAGPPTPDFSLSCSPSSLSVLQGQSGSSTCTVTSTGGFSSAVTLSCANLPAGASCAYNPNPVTPPANGPVNSTLTVSTGSAAAGTYSFQARGVNGATTRNFNMSLTITAPPTPNFALSCNPSSLSVQQGASGTSSCSVTSSGSFSNAVTLSCSGLPSGASCGYSPNPVTPPANGSASSGLTVTVASSVAAGTYPFTASGTGGGLTRSFSMTLTVTSPGGGAQTAVFDPTLRAPRCGAVGSSCTAGTGLLNSRDTMATPEPNQPNTLSTSAACADGTAGTYHVDESVDSLRVATTDGSSLAPGKTVTISATVWAWSGFTSDKLDLYYAANANSPAWTFLTTLTPVAAGSQTLSANYTLPTGTLQAVRAQFRYVGTASSCTVGAYNDRDDLAFAVNAPPPAQQLLINPGFESGATAWVATPAVIDNSTGRPARTGLWKAWLDGYGTNHTDTLYQQVTIPSTATTATLSFWLRIDTAETSTSIAWDTLKVQIRNSSGAVLATLATYSNLNANSTYVLKSFNVSAYRGQTIRVYLEGIEDISLQTSFVVDDFALTAQ